MLKIKIYARHVYTLVVLLPKLTVMLKYLVVSTTCFESAREPVKKLSTDPAPFACKSEFRVFSARILNTRMLKLNLHLSPVPENNVNHVQGDQVDQHS